MIGNYLTLSVALFFTGFLLTAVITLLLIQVASRKGVVDIPNARSSHGRPVPRGGGLSIVIVYLCFLTYTHTTDQPDILNAMRLWLLAGGSLVALVGFVDDLRDIRPLWRFLVHLGAASLALVFLPTLPSLPIINYSIEPGLIGSVLIIVALVWFINLFNFMDGIDGIAGVQTLTMLGSALVIMLMQGIENWLAAPIGFLMACVAGFLIWNWPPAKVFMGDACSGFLGFALGALAVTTSLDGSLNLWVWAILAGVFIIDSTTTLIRRMLRREKWYQPHRSHAYQILSRRFDSHTKITVGVLAINLLWLFPLALAAAHNPAAGLPLCLVSWTPILVLAIWAGAGTEESALETRL